MTQHEDRWMERPKMLIWTENTYKQRKNQNGKGRVGVESKKGKGEEEGATDLFSKR
jgi:hypothetical protein